MTTFAVVPAGGKSSRMGRPKLSLPVGAETVIGRVVAALKNGGVEQVLVVIGPHATELVPLAQKAGAHVQVLAQETPDMRATVEAGLQWLEDRFHPRPDDDWLLVPADHPTLDAEVLRQLRAARVGLPAVSIFIPTFQGKRGHPISVGWRHTAGIREHPPGLGLNTYFRQFAADTMELPVTNAGILSDLDTPADYARLLQSL